MDITIEKPSLDYEQYIIDKGGFFQSKAYLDLLSHSIGMRFSVLVARDDGRVSGVLPFACLKSKRLGLVINSLPFYGSHGGVITNDEETGLLLLAYFERYCQDRNCAAWTIVQGLTEPETADKQNNFYKAALGIESKDYRFGQVTDISLDVDLMGSFHQKTRNMVRKSQKSGFFIDQGDQFLNDLIQTHQENVTEIGGISKPAVFFESIPQYFDEDQFKLYAALDEKGDSDGNRNFAAGLLCFYFGDYVEYFTPAVKKEYRSLQPLSLLIFHAMKEAQSIGYKFWNWGGTWPTQDGVYRFKSRWGAIDWPYQYYTKILNEELKHCSKEELLEEFPYFYVVPYSDLAS